SLSSTLRLLRFFPVSVELFQRELSLPSAVLFLHAFFDVIEALRELVDRPAERALGIDLEVAREIHEREEAIAHLFLDRVGVLLFDGGFELAEFLADLGARALLVLPIEADAGDLLADALGARERGERSRNAGEDAPIAFLLRLELLPVR